MKELENEQVNKEIQDEIGNVIEEEPEQLRTGVYNTHPSASAGQKNVGQPSFNSGNNAAQTGRQSAVNQQAAGAGAPQDQKKENDDEYEPKVEYEQVFLNGVPNEAFLGTSEERRATGQQYLNGYDAQKTMLDKALFYVYYEMKNFLTSAAPDPRYDTMLSVDVDKSLSDEEKKRLVDEAQKNLDEAYRKREEIGISKTGFTSPEDEATDLELDRKFYKDLIGNGSRSAIIKGLKNVQLVSTYGEYYGGLAVKENLDKIPENDPNRMKKALYLASYNNASVSNLLGAAKGAIDASVRMKLQPDPDNDELGISQILLNNLNFNKQMKVSSYLKKMGFNRVETEYYLRNNGFTEDETVYDAFRRKLENEGEETTEQNIIYSIKKDYLKEFTESIINEFNGNSKMFLDQHYDEYLTIEDYMDILKYNDVEKTAFMKEMGAREKTDLIYGLFWNRIMKDEEAKKELIDKKIMSGISPEEAQIIYPDDIKSYMKDFAEREDNRFKFATYEYKDTVTIEKFLGTIGYTNEEIDKYVRDRNVTRDVTAKTVMTMEYVRTLGPDQINNVQDEDIYGFAERFIESERNRLQKEGRDKVFINTGFAMRDQFHQSLETEEEKEIHNFGIRVVANEDKVNVEPHPRLKKAEFRKTEKEKNDAAYKEWVVNEARPNIYKSYYDELAVNYGNIRQQCLSGKSLEFDKNKTVLRFLDTSVPNVDTTLLRGIITMLEASRGGYGTGHKDTAKFRNMLDSLQKFEYKLSTNDVKGINDLKNTLIEHCKEYVRRREGVRDANYGNDRFDAASTVLYTLLPKDEFVTWAQSVNRKRKTDKITWARCQTKQAKFLIDQQAKEEEAQNAADKMRVSMPEEYAKRFIRVEKFISMNPEFDDKFDGVFDREQFADKIKPIGENEKLSLIGPSHSNRNLSDKDFTAIVFAATLTPEAATEDPRLRNHFENKMLFTGRDYTTELAKKNPPAECGKYFDVIVAGRNAAINALNEYSAGNKHPLAHILAAGIRNIAANGRAMDKMNEDIYMHSEMGKRIIEMLNRDPELANDVALNYTAEFKEDMNYIKSINSLSNIYLKSVNSQKFIERIAKGNPDVAKNYDTKTKEELVTDVLVSRLIEDSNAKYLEKRNNDPKYKAKITAAVKTYNAAKMNLAKRGLGADDQAPLSPEEYAAEERKIEVELKYAKAAAADQHRYNPLVTSLSRKSSVDALRESVKKVVKDSGIAKKSMDKIVAELKSSSIVKKVAALSQQTREQKDQEHAKKVAAEAAKKRAAQRNNNNPAL